MMQPGELSELAAMANIRCSELADSMVQMSYLVGDKQWDRVADRCIQHLHALNLLAGTVAQLLPCAPAQDAPREVA